MGTLRNLVFSITDMNGKQVHHSSSPTSSIKLDITTYPKRIYLVNIITDSGNTFNHKNCYSLRQLIHTQSINYASQNELYILASFFMVTYNNAQFLNQISILFLHGSLYMY